MVNIGDSICGTNAKNKLLELSNSVKQLKGDIVEVGVYKGGSAQILSDIFVDDDIFLFDTFEGMPETNQFDNIHVKGDFNDVLYEDVVKYFSNYKNVTIYKGHFPHQNSQGLENRKFKFVHLDVDIYDSYKDCLNFFNGKMIEGGVMLFDDYSAATCGGAKIAVDEYIQQTGHELIIGGDFQSYIIF